MPGSIIRAVVVWLLFILAESVQGVLRRVVFGPEVDWMIRQASVGLGVAVLFAIAWFATPWMRLRNAAAALAVGLGWALTTLAFEIGFGRLTGAAWETIASDFDPRRGGMMALGLLAMAIAPLAAYSARRSPVVTGGAAPNPVPSRDGALAAAGYAALATGLSGAIVGAAVLLAARHLAG